MTHSAVHPLDHPVWLALTTEQAPFAQGRGLARAFPPTIARFAAMEEPTPAGFAALAEVLGPQMMAITLTAAALEVPRPWTVLQDFVIVQMVGDTVDEAPDREYPVLGEADVPDMLALVNLTRPGPFAAETYRLGTYYGLRVDGQLVAMAGERLHLRGFTEISAVCTHPDHQGRGYGKALVQRVSQGILARGERPFLHVKTDNAGAVRAYRRVGFEERVGIHATVPVAPSGLTP
ncbi:GNAT family N-acetyltransferase [Deinococcus sp. KSM4-11]|uniref:GNAT family N-acetyltransferase n=1 Tax=Deinococcus sp. KSM4-11 TaxID=2568654 RepID=UPI0010A3D98F|nr:GNAT family N-acetyltransferase [Deinococcus sp. KSM4-11]THF86995.1 GNAT family N-acetyltransferase [Deinococcus sp. KSM4-11]